jgi:hypothetical protein
MMVNHNLVGGFSPTPLKNDGVKVSWDDEIPDGKIKNVPNRQSDEIHPHFQGSNMQLQVCQRTILDSLKSLQRVHLTILSLCNQCKHTVTQ